MAEQKKLLGALWRLVQHYVAACASSKTAREQIAAQAPRKASGSVRFGLGGGAGFGWDPVFFFLGGGVRFCFPRVVFLGFLCQGFGRDSFAKKSMEVDECGSFLMPELSEPFPALRGTSKSGDRFKGKRQ